jgi:hypothetical protein
VQELAVLGRKQGKNPSNNADVCQIGEQVPVLQMDQRMRIAMTEADPWSTFADNLKCLVYLLVSIKLIIIFK